MSSSPFVDDAGADLASATWESPIGPLRLVASSTSLRQLHFPNHDPALPVLEATLLPDPRRHPVLKVAVQALEQIFAGKRTDTGPALAPAGTDFQKRVWVALMDIPRGETLAYGALASALGDAGAVRAVAAANARNPIGIFIPCHRVVAADGHLTGFAGGLDAKEHLLHLEGARRTRQPSLF